MYGNVIAMIGFSITIDPASVATITTAEQSFTIPGLRVNDIVYLSKPTNSTGVAPVNYRVSAADTLAVTFVNPTAGAVNAVSETWTGLMVRFDALRVGNATA